MKEVLEKRKAEFARYLHEQYMNKQPKKWWQTPDPIYQTTSEFANNESIPLITKKEIVIKNDLTTQLISVLIFAIVIVSLLQPWHIKSENILWATLALVLVIIFFRTHLDRKPKIILNKEGFWLHTINSTISWQHVIASYIRIDKSDDSAIYHLVIHFYDDYTDTFEKSEYLLDGLELSNTQIAAQIEYWKKTAA